MITPRAKVNFLSNKELLLEINKSKASYSFYLEPEYMMYDAIVHDRADITPELIQELRVKRSRPRGKPNVPVESIDSESIVVRLMTYEHIPLDPHRVRKSRTTDESYAWTNFTPYKHFIMVDGELKEVLRSHWVNGFENGHFEVTQGKITDQLTRMFILFVNRLGSRGNYRGYSYIEDMKGQALVQLSQVGLQFNEAKSDNVFAYYTTACNNVFVRFLNQEKKVQGIRDDVLVSLGASPSYSRQTHDAEAMAQARAPDTVKVFTPEERMAFLATRSDLN